MKNTMDRNSPVDRAIMETLTQMSEDESHLNSLAIAHYVVGAVMIAFACLPLLHLGLGAAMLAGAIPMEAETEGNLEVVPDLFAWLFIGMGGLFFLIGQAVSVGIVISGRFLKQRRHYLFSFILACLMCTFVPVGTILGVFTIVVLSRDSVKRRYGRMPPA
jgi:hypothetical protein